MVKRKGEIDRLIAMIERKDRITLKLGKTNLSAYDTSQRDLPL